ncbi:uncharacterized protein si:ch211-89o9.4 isoform X2 [Puntigrus tetrazona]|uniref:uncharacterized protein si:ch211-89o9.4 isoform X2 n=1 Tax=Puntigrus tetrazona TaxID=1606681 RepID=UPI001C8A71CC|nr:uncharacterized protein si:ch211-89o9.4 isoform X2 [Puntigrus tetrazona]
MKNSLQRKITSNSTLTKANVRPHAAQINPRPVCVSQTSGVFSSAPPLFGTAQAFLLRLAQLEAQLVLSLISNVAAGNNGNPLVPLNLLPPVGIQRSSFLSMYQHPGGFKHTNSIPHVVSHPSTTVTEMNSVTANKESAALLPKEIIQEKTLSPIIHNNTTLPLPTSEESLFKSSSNHLGKHFALKPHMSCSQYQSVTAKATMPPERPQTEEGEPKQQTMLQYPTENLIKALTSLGLSLEDLELLSHCPDNQLTAENLPFIIQDIQKRKETKDSKCGRARWISSAQVKSSKDSSHTYGEQRNLRIVNGRGSNSFLKRLQQGTSWRPASVYFPPRSKSNIRHSAVSSDCNKARHYATQGPLSSPHRSNTYNAMTKGHRQSSFPVKSAKSEETAESFAIQMPVTQTTAKPQANTKGVIRVSGIPLDYSESELSKMASPFGHSVEVLMATEIDTTTCLERKKLVCVCVCFLQALLMFPTDFSAKEMVKVYSAIPVHMRQQRLELVSQTVVFSSPVSVFHAFVGPSLSNGLLAALDRLLVVCNVPNQPSAAIGVLRLLKPFGQVFRALVLHGNKADVDQCLGNHSSIQMVLEMESASVALSVYEWSRKIPCFYHNCHLSFLRGCNIQKKCI